MTIKPSSAGQLAMSEINAEFGRGNDLNAYRGVQWWTDDNQTGTFSAGQISFWEFYGKRATPPVNPGVREFAFIGNTGTATINLGADNAKRYIVLVAHDQVANANNTQKITECTLGGVAMTLIGSNSAYGVADGGDSVKISIFGGYFPSGATAAVAYKLGNGNAVSCVTGSYRLVGDNIQATQVSTSGFPITFNMVAQSVVILGFSNANGSQNTSYTGVTEHYTVNPSGWKYGSGSYYAAAPEARSVTSIGTKVAALFYSP